MKTTNFFVALFLCISAVSFSQVPDPGVSGPLSVTKELYDFGNSVVSLPSLNDQLVEVTGSVHYPQTLSQQYPVLVFLHGRHSACYLEDGSLTPQIWPCPNEALPIPSYEGYDYLAEKLASHGFIVISISANGIATRDNAMPDFGSRARAELIQHHLDLWNKWNTTGGTPFGNKFIGKLDMNRIGTMGHSRGGEGVVEHALYNRELGSPYGIQAVLTLAPVNFNGNILRGIPLLNVAPYCDGDVYDLQGLQYYDDARYNSPIPDNAPKHSILMLGANHNFFNTYWTPVIFPFYSEDDWGRDEDSHCGLFSLRRFSTEKQRNALTAYASAFFRLYVRSESEFKPILTEVNQAPPASSGLSKDDVFLSYHPPKNLREDIHSYSLASPYNTNDLGGNVSSNAENYSLCSDQCDILGRVGTAATIVWNSLTNDQSYENNIPDAHKDFSGFKFFQFRAANRDLSSETTQDFSVTFVDENNNSSTVMIRDFSDALYSPPGEIRPKTVLHTIQIPLETLNGVDLTKIDKIIFDFDVNPSGDIIFTDLALSGTRTGCASIIENYPYNESFENSFGSWSQSNTDDTDWLIKSGNTPSSGTGPSQAFDGNYYLYVEASSSYNPPGTPFKRAILESPCFDLSNLDNPAMSFSYHMYGSQAQMGSLDLEISTDNGSNWSVLWSETQGQGGNWQEVSIDLSDYADQTVQYRFNRYTADSWRADVAIDDISVFNALSEGACDQVVNAFPYTESFENSLGLWSQSDADDSDWLIQSGNTPSSGTGPGESAHGNYYLYMEASSSYNPPGTPFKRAILESPCFDLSSLNNPTISFDYHMYGSQTQMGSLALEISSDNGSNWDVLWSESEEHGDNWQAVNLDLSDYADQTVQFRFNRYTANSWRADVAIDNIKVSDELSGISCDQVVDAFPYNERFENSLGLWSQSNADDTDWLIQSGSTPSNGTGPSQAIDGNYYVYVEASSSYNPPGTPFKRAILESPCFDLGSLNNPAMSFNYHMYGSQTQIGSLALEISTDNGSNWSVIWNESEEQGDNWQAASVDLSDYAGRMIRVRFNRYTANSWRADVAIDNLSIEDQGQQSNCHGTTLDLVMTFDNYPQETSWAVTNSLGSIVASSNGIYGPDQTGSTQVESISLPQSGTYTFTISDSYGDGICCSEGNGSYTLTGSNGVIITGGNFGSSESIEFCVENNRTQSTLDENNLTQLDQIVLYPNPVENELQLVLPTEMTELEYQILDLTGRIISSGSIIGNRIDAAELPAAIYYLKLTDRQKSVVKKFQKK